MSARLVVTRAGKPFADVDLGEVTIIGREPGVDILLPSEGVSRHHARVAHTEEGWLLEDLWSRNGTLVNGRRVRRRPLAEGDRIEICEFTLTFRSSEESIPGRQPQATMVIEEGPPPQAPSRSRPVEADGVVVGAAERDELQRLRSRLQAIYEVTDALDITLNLGEFLDKALAKVLETFPQADVAVLTLKDPHTGKFAPSAVRVRKGLDPAKVRVSSSVMREAAAGRQAILSSLPAKDPRFRATMTIRRSSIAALMCVPLIYHKDVTGQLYVDSRRPGVAFQDDDLALLSWLGKEINLALERSRMRRELLRRERVERDMRLAAEVQRSFLPEEPPSVEGYEFALHHSSAMGVGGDFYDFLPLPGGRLALVIGEVAGRGISAAILAARVTSHIRYLSLQHSSPAEVLNELNSLLVERAPRGSFATMLYAILDPPSRKLTMASASHPAPIRAPAEPGGVEPVELPRQFPLGALDDTEYEDLTIGLDLGDLLVLYTDGVSDASNAEGVWYGQNRLEGTVAAAPREPRAMVEALTDDLASFADEAGQNDDITIIICQAMRR